MENLGNDITLSHNYMVVIWNTSTTTNNNIWTCDGSFVLQRKWFLFRKTIYEESPSLWPLMARAWGCYTHQVQRHCDFPRLIHMPQTERRACDVHKVGNDPYSTRSSFILSFYFMSLITSHHNKHFSVSYIFITTSSIYAGLSLACDCQWHNTHFWEAQRRDRGSMPAWRSTA